MRDKVKLNIDYHINKEFKQISTMIMLQITVLICLVIHSFFDFISDFIDSNTDSNGDKHIRQGIADNNINVHQ